MVTKMVMKWIVVKQRPRSMIPNEMEWNGYECHSGGWGRERKPTDPYGGMPYTVLTVCVYVCVCAMFWRMMWIAQQSKHQKYWKLDSKKCQNWTCSYVRVFVAHSRQAVKIHIACWCDQCAFQFLNNNTDAQALLFVVVLFYFVAVVFSLRFLLLLLIFSFNAS